MIGEEEAIVLDVKPWDVHGVRMFDVTLTYPDRLIETVRLGAESVPPGLEAGEQVLVSKAMSVVVRVRRS